MGEWSGPATADDLDDAPLFRDRAGAGVSEALDKELPVIRDDKKVSGYIRMEQKRGLIGIYEKRRPQLGLA